MTATSPSAPPAAPGAGVSLAQAFRWHRPLMVLAAAMAALAVVATVGLLVDDRTLTGLPIWAKPTKFALSVLIYAVTWSWLIAQLDRLRRTAWWLGTVAAVFLGFELVIIVGQVLRGTTSHFNQTTPFDTMLWRVMGMSIVVVWLATLAVCVILFRNTGADRGRTLAVRGGSVLAVVGMALGYLMVMPTSRQIAEGESISGAHTVGLADGGPGLPLLGWSTVGGDLRIPHFVGMHALQLIPLAAIALELLARRWPLLGQQVVKARLVAVAIAGYTALIGVLAWQALRGQSIVHPDALTGLALGAIVLGVAAAGFAALRAGRPFALDRSGDGDRAGGLVAS